MLSDILSDIYLVLIERRKQRQDRIIENDLFDSRDDLYTHTHTHTSCFDRPDFTSITAAGRILMRKSNETRFKLNLIPPINKLRKSTNCTRDIKNDIYPIHRFRFSPFLSIFHTYILYRLFRLLRERREGYDFPRLVK